MSIEWIDSYDCLVYLELLSDDEYMDAIGSVSY